MSGTFAFHNIYTTKNEVENIQTVLHEGNESGELLAGADPADRLCGSNSHFQCDLGRQFQIFDFAIGSNGVPYYLYCGQGAAGGSAE